MRFYNTLGRRVEEFKPISQDHVKFYSCGPTVYSFYHIGNLRNAVFNDTLRRTLEASGFGVKHVVNITDVGHLTGDADEGEDKLEKGASAEGKTVWEVADFYTEAFKKDLAELNVLPPNGYHGKKNNYARATDFIAEQIEMVKILLEKEFAYQAEQAIYFDVTKLSDYGKLTGQKLSEKEVATRPEIVTDKSKRHPQDFALWFFAVGHFEGHSMKWDSPWGEGFPGWHLECSAIIHATIGDPIDIHTGAVDLIGTHHTNEIAQTEAAYGNNLANYWIHNEYVLINGQKMSKSLGNIYNLSDIKKKSYDPLALRLLFLQAHYRSQMNFTWESLDAASSNLNDIYAWADQQFQTHVASLSNEEAAEAKKLIRGAMEDNLNSAAGLAVLNELIVKRAPSADLLEYIDKLWGFDLADRSDISDQEKQLVKDRAAARDNSQWDKSDLLRDRLAELGLGLNDTDQGTVWFRTSR
jgi:cysteinyl-tRNA synthetase